jgi:hypothetical protein
MSLPAGQQRILDGMAEALRVSEPRLAAMFAIFTRLTTNEATPRREQLTAGPRWLDWLHGLARWLPSRQTERGRWGWRRVLILSQMAIAFVVLAVLVGLGTGGAVGCAGSQASRAAAVSAARGRVCPPQAGPDLDSVGK